MQRKAIVVVLFILTALTIAQAQEQYFDVYYTQIKPEKRADFDAIAKKIASANRKNHGDTWFALETVYGTGNRVSFISIRGSYADIDKASDAFMGSMAKSYGADAAQKVFQDFTACTASTRAEFRRVRFDLSSNVPSDPAAFAKMMGGVRWIRTTVVHLKPGQIAEFEGIFKEIKYAAEKTSPPTTLLVAQATAGQEGTVFYVSWPVGSMGDFDKAPSAHQLLGDDGYARYLKVSAETVQSAETVISRVVPELSNPPAEMAVAAPDFWTPKPEMPAKAKPAAKSSKKTK